MEVVYGVTTTVTVVSAKNRSAANGGGIWEGPEAHAVSSADEPSGQVALVSTAPERSKKPKAPSRLASVRSVPSSEPPMKFTRTVFCRLAPLKSAYERSASTRMASLKLTSAKLAPERLLPERSTRPT